MCSTLARARTGPSGRAESRRFLEEGRLARAVAPHDGDALAARDDPLPLPVAERHDPPPGRVARIGQVDAHHVVIAPRGGHASLSAARAASSFPFISVLNRPALTWAASARAPRGSWGPASRPAPCARRAIAWRACRTTRCAAGAHAAGDWAASRARRGRRPPAPRRGGRAGAVRTADHIESVVVQLGGGIHQLQQADVVTDDDQRAGPPPYEAAHARPRIAVEVVRRLVEECDVGRAGAEPTRAAIIVSPPESSPTVRSRASGGRPASASRAWARASTSSRASPTASKWCGATSPDSIARSCR